MKRNKLIILMILLSIIFTSCTQESTSQTAEIKETIYNSERMGLIARAAKQKEIGDTMRYGLNGYPTNMNPFYTDTASSKRINEILFEPLFYLRSQNLNYEIEENLLESLEVSEDNKVFTLNIKNNALWHDGRPVTSDDIIFSINYTIENKDTKYKDLFKIDGEPVAMAKNGDKALTITLPRTSMSFIYNLANLTVVPSHLYSDMDNKYISIKDKEYLVGNGPYRFDNTYYDTTSFTDYFRFNEFEDFYGEKPKFPRIEAKVAVHATSLRYEMLDYNIQAGYVNSNDTGPLADANYNIYDFPQGEVVKILYKESGLFGKYPEIKDAFLQAMNVDSIKGNFGTSSYVTPANSIFSEDNPYRLNDSAFAESNTQKAKDTLLRFSLEHPDEVIKFGFILDSGEPQERVAVALQESFKTMGVDLELVPLYRDEFEAKLYDPKNNEFDICLYSYDSSPNPDSYKYYFQTDSSSNLTGYSNPDLDAMWAKADAEADPVQRKVLYDEIQRIIMREKPVFPLLYIKTAFAVDQRIDNVEEAIPQARGFFRYPELIDKIEAEFKQEDLDAYEITPKDLEEAPNNEEINNRVTPLED